MPNFASISIIGHLGKDAEVNTTQSGMATTRFSIAFATGYGDKKATTWARCTWFGERGQKVAGYLLKGRPVMVIGEPSLREWTDEAAGKTRTSLDVIVRDVVLLGSKDDGEKTAEEPTPIRRAPRQDSFDAPPF